MQTRRYGYTSFNDHRFTQGMNAWLGHDVYSTIRNPSATTVRTAVKESFVNGYPIAVDERERYGGEHFNGHANAAFGHITVVSGYNSKTDAVQFLDTSAGMWTNPTGAQNQRFWYPSLQNFVTNHLVMTGGRDGTGLYTS